MVEMTDAQFAAFLQTVTTAAASAAQAAVAALPAAAAATPAPARRRIRVAEPSKWSGRRPEKGEKDPLDPVDWKLSVERYMRATNDDYLDDNERVAAITSYLEGDAQFWARPINSKDPECLITIGSGKAIPAWSTPEAFWAFFDAEWTSHDSVERAESDIRSLYQKEGEDIAGYTARMRSAFLRAQWNTAHPAVWWVYRTHLSRPIQANYLLVNGAEREASLEESIAAARTVETHLANQPRERRAAPPSAPSSSSRPQTFSTRPKPSVSAAAAPVDGKTIQCGKCGLHGHATDVCKSKYSAAEWAAMTPDQRTAHTTARKLAKQAGVSASKGKGKEPFPPQPAESDSDSDQANAAALRRRRTKTRTSSRSSGPSALDWRQVQGKRSLSEPSTVSDTVPSVEPKPLSQAEAKAARRKASLEAEARRKQQLQDAKELEASRQKRMEAFYKKTAPSSSPTASSSSAKSDTPLTRVATTPPAASVPAPASEPASSSQSRWLAAAMTAPSLKERLAELEHLQDPFPGMSYPEDTEVYGYAGGGYGSDADVVSLYSEDGKLPPLSKFNWAADVEADMALRAASGSGEEGTGRGGASGSRRPLN